MSNIKAVSQCLRCPSCDIFFTGAPNLFLNFFKEEFRWKDVLLCSKIYYCCDITSNKFKFNSRGLNKRVLKQIGDAPLDKYRRVLDEKTNIASTNRGFHAHNHDVATYEQIEKESPSFFQKGI